MQLRHIELGDDPSAWRALGFAVDASGRFRLGATVLSVRGIGGGFLSWWIEGIGGDLDGIPSVVPESLGDPAPPAEHPNGISRIDHLVVVTGDSDRTVAAFERAGLELRRARRTTRHGSAVRQSFLWAGDVILEVVGPGEGEPASDRPAAILGLALVSEDLASTAATLGPLMGSPKEAVQSARQIAGLRGGEVGIGLSLAVMSPHPR